MKVYRKKGVTDTEYMAIVLSDKHDIHKSPSFIYQNYDSYSSNLSISQFDLHKIAEWNDQTHLWSLRWSCRRNALLQISHEYGRSSVCVRSCINKLYDFVKCRLQNLHINCFFGRCTAVPLPNVVDIVDAVIDDGDAVADDDIMLVVQSFSKLGKWLPIKFVDCSIGESSGDSNGSVSSESKIGSTSSSLRSFVFASSTSEFRYVDDCSMIIESSFVSWSGSGLRKRCNAK